MVGEPWTTGLQEDDFCEPYEVSEWPVKRVRARSAEVRNQFETRNIELSLVLRLLSRMLRVLTFRLMTLCLDDGDVETWEMRAGKMRTGRVSDQRWKRA